jgi:hypothetical protein
MHVVMYCKAEVRAYQNHRGKTAVTLDANLCRGRFNDNVMKREAWLDYAQVIGRLHQECNGLRHCGRGPCPRRKAFEGF